MKILLVLLLLVSSFSYGASYKVAAYSWEPFVDLKRTNGGISIGLLRKVMKSQGHEIELVSAPWSDSLTMLEENKVDILPAVWFTQERTKTMEYSESYAANRLVFIKAKGSDYEYNGIASLYDKKVGIVKGYAYEENFLKEKNIKFSVADSLNENVRKVISGEVELTLDDEIASQVSIEPSLLEKIEFTKNALNEIPLYITCNKSNPNCKSIIEDFNKGLSVIKSKHKFK
ncbi:MAG: transporter substrate-binding domain-containing protein [Cellvibrionaceae bacterium]